MHSALRVALDARPLTTSRAGVASYCRGLMYGLNDVAHDLCLLLYAKDPAPEQFNSEVVACWRSMPARLWLPTAVPRALSAGRVDLFHGTNHMIPPLCTVPTVVTVHDLSALTMPHLHTWRNRLLSVPQMVVSLQRATRIIAVSHSTARDVSRIPGVDTGRIRVVHLAPSPGLVPATPEAVKELVHRLQLPERFFLFLGALEPRKNVAGLVRALGLLRAESHSRARLVIAGAEGWRNDDVHAEVRRLGLEGIVRFVGFIDARDLAALYGAAAAFVYPSLFEGFGLPLLEAMACGTPVITSNSSSIPEVVGDSALLVDPRSERDLASAMRSVWDDEQLRASLRVLGLIRAASFSWQRTARETAQVYREAAEQR